MLRVRLLPVLGLAICALIIAVLSARSSGSSGGVQDCNHNLPERADWKIPDYPGARQVQSRDSDVHWQVMATFLVTDPPAQIAEFYDTALTKAGWQRGNSGSGLTFHAENCCYYLNLLIETEIAAKGQTLVTVKRNASMGCG